MTSNSGDEYEVGYKKPPRQHRFKPGEKQPRRGKTEGAKASGHELWAILQEDRIVAVKGRRTRMTNLEVILRRFMEKVEQGNASLLRLYYELSMSSSPEPDEMFLDLDGVVTPFPQEPMSPG